MAPGGDSRVFQFANPIEMLAAAVIFSNLEL
jgi:hypothetical protein